jgi:hypothetical protein
MLIAHALEDVGIDFEMAGRDGTTGGEAGEPGDG